MRIQSKMIANNPTIKRLLYVGLFASLAVLMGADKGCVTSPTIDTIVTTSPIKVEGNISEFNAAGSFVANHDGNVRLNVNGINLPSVTTVSKAWKYDRVNLNIGVNRIRGTTERAGPVTGVIPEFIIERKTDLSSRGEQKVYFDWSDAGIDTMLKNMATHTLEPDPGAADLNSFVTQVKSGVENFVKKAYTGITITVVAASGAEVHTIKFYGNSYNRCGLYGVSDADYKNATKQQTSSIYIKAFECKVADDNALLTSTPAKTTDTMATRVTDIATFIGRTAAHEFGHSLGLVAESALLHGCDGWHNCDAYDTANPADRFDSGHYIMDPGLKSVLYARIGQANATTRKSQPPKFNAYNRSYLDIIH